MKTFERPFYRRNTLIEENEQLKAEIERLRAIHVQLVDEVFELKEQNKELRSKLERLSDEERIDEDRKELERLKVAIGFKGHELLDELNFLRDRHHSSLQALEAYYEAIVEYLKKINDLSFNRKEDGQCRQEDREALQTNDQNNQATRR